MLCPFWRDRHSEGVVAILNRDLNFEHPPTLAIAVASSLQEAILQGAFAQGQHLNEADLCREFGVSRATVREAFRHLQSQGLVEARSHVGASVALLNEDIINVAFRLRALLEPYALFLAWESGAFTDALKQELRGLAECRNGINEDDNMVHVMRIDHNFHSLLCGASGHRLLLLSLRGPAWLARFAVATAAANAIVPLPMKDHSVVLDHIDAGQVEKASRALEAHIESTRNIVLQTRRA